MITPMPGKRWIRCVQYATLIGMSFAIGGLLLTLLTFGYLPSETLIPAALVVIGSPLAIWQIRRINRLIYDYEHAYDDTQALDSDEGRPTDQPT